MILDDKAEIVVGTARGGRGRDHWPLFSRLSRGSRLVAVGLSGMTRPHHGYMAVRRSCSSASPRTVGWEDRVETVVKAHPPGSGRGAHRVHRPGAGESKQSLRVLEQYMLHLYKLYAFRFPTFVELLKFCLVGFFGLLVDLSIVFALKRAFALDTRLCQVFGFAAAVTFNYAINRRFSFRDARSTPLLRSYVAYVGANLVG